VTELFNHLHGNLTVYCILGSFWCRYIFSTLAQMARFILAS